MSSSFGGGGNGQIRYVISVDDSQAIQQLQSLDQSLQTIGQTSQQTAQQIQQTAPALDQVTQSTGQFSQANADMAAELQATDIQLKNTKTSTQSFGSVLKENIGSIVQMGVGIVGLVANYVQIQRAQVFLNRLQVSEANQRRALAVLTRQHAAAVAKYGANSQEAVDIENKRVIAEQRLGVTMDQISVKQEQVTLGQVNFGLSLIQTATGISQAATGLKTYKSASDAAAVATTGLATGINKLKVATVIGAILVAIEIAAQAVANNFGGLRDRLNELYNWLVKLAPAFRPVIDAIWTIGQALTALFTGDVDALTKMFSRSAAAAPGAVAGVDDLGMAIDSTGKAAVDAQKEIDDMWKTASEGNQIATALNIKVDENKITKKILDYMPDSVQKDIELKIKGQKSIAGVKSSITEIFALGIKGLQLPEKEIDGYIKDWIKYLHEKLPKAPGSQQIQDDLAKIAAGPDSEKKLQEYIQKWNLPPDTGKNLGIQLGTNVANGVKEVPDSVWDAAFAKPEEHVDFLNGVKVQKPIDISETLANLGKALTDPVFWKDVGKRILDNLFSLWKAIDTYVMPVLANIGKTLTDVKFWNDVGTRALKGLFAIWAGIQTYVLPVLADIGKTLTDPKFWNDVGTRMLNFLWQGWQTVKTWGKQVMDWINTQINTQMDNYKKIGEKMGGWILDGIKQSLIQSNVNKAKNLLDLGSIFSPQTAEGADQFPGVKSFDDPSNKLTVGKTMTNSAGTTYRWDGKKWVLVKKWTAPHTTTSGYIPVGAGSDIFQLTPQQAEEINKQPGPADLGKTKNVTPALANPAVEAQKLQTALKNLAVQAANSLRILANGAKTSLNTLSNYAKGASVFAQQLQTGLANLSNQGIKSEVALGKASKTQFNSVANYAKGAEVGAQDLQKGLANLSNQGIKSMVALGKSAKTQFNTVANYADGATKAVNKLSAAIRSMPKVPSGGGGSSNLRFAQGGMHETIGQNTLILAHAGERVDIGHGSNQGGSNTVNQQINLHISGSDLINERNLTKRIKLTVGENRDRFS